MADKYTIELKIQGSQSPVKGVGRFIKSLYSEIVCNSEYIVLYFTKGIGFDYLVLERADISIIDTCYENLHNELERQNGYWSKQEVQEFLNYYPYLKQFVVVSKQIGWCTVNLENEFTLKE